MSATDTTRLAAFASLAASLSKRDSSTVTSRIQRSDASTCPPPQERVSSPVPTHGHLSGKRDWSALMISAPSDVSDASTRASSTLEQLLQESLDREQQLAGLLDDALQTKKVDEGTYMRDMKVMQEEIARLNNGLEDVTRKLDDYLAAAPTSLSQANDPLRSVSATCTDIDQASTPAPIDSISNVATTSSDAAVLDSRSYTDSAVTNMLCEVRQEIGSAMANCHRYTDAQLAVVLRDERQANLNARADVLSQAIQYTNGLIGDIQTVVGDQLDQLDKLNAKVDRIDEDIQARSDSLRNELTLRVTDEVDRCLVSANSHTDSVTIDLSQDCDVRIDELNERYAAVVSTVRDFADRTLKSANDHADGRIDDVMQKWKDILDVLRACVHFLTMRDPQQWLKDRLEGNAEMAQDGRFSPEL